jgi:hypothetical protein
VTAQVDSSTIEIGASLATLSLTIAASNFTVTQSNSAVAVSSLSLRATASAVSFVRVNISKVVKAVVSGSCLSVLDSQWSTSAPGAMRMAYSNVSFVRSDAEITGLAEIANPADEPYLHACFTMMDKSSLTFVSSRLGGLTLNTSCVVSYPRWRPYASGSCEIVVWNTTYSPAAALVAPGCTVRLTTTTLPVTYFTAARVIAPSSAVRWVPMRRFGVFSVAQLNSTRLRVEAPTKTVSFGALDNVTVELAAEVGTLSVLQTARMSTVIVGATVGALSLAVTSTDLLFLQTNATARVNTGTLTLSSSSVTLCNVTWVTGTALLQSQSRLTAVGSTWGLSASQPVRLRVLFSNVTVVQSDVAVATWLDIVKTNPELYWYCKPVLENSTATFVDSVIRAAVFNQSCPTKTQSFTPYLYRHCRFFVEHIANSSSIGAPLCTESALSSDDVGPAVLAGCAASPVSVMFDDAVTTLDDETMAKLNCAGESAVQFDDQWAYRSPTRSLTPSLRTPVRDRTRTFSRHHTRIASRSQTPHSAPLQRTVTVAVRPPWISSTLITAARPVNRTRSLSLSVNATPVLPRNSSSTLDQPLRTVPADDIAKEVVEQAVVIASVSVVTSSLFSMTAAVRVSRLHAGLRSAERCITKVDQAEGDEEDRLTPSWAELPFMVSVGSSDFAAITGRLLLCVVLQSAIGVVHAVLYGWRPVSPKVVENSTAILLPFWVSYFGVSASAYAVIVFTADHEPIRLDLIVAAIVVVVHLAFSVLSLVIAWRFADVMAENAWFSAAFGPLYDSARCREKTLHRCNFGIEVVLSTLFAAVAEWDTLPCSYRVWILAVTALAMTVYESVIQPYESRIDTVFSVVQSVLQLLLAVLIVVGERLQGLWEPAAWVATVMSAGFFFQALAHAVYAVYTHCTSASPANRRSGEDVDDTAVAIGDDEMLLRLPAVPVANKSRQEEGNETPSTGKLANPLL